MPTAPFLANFPWLLLRGDHEICSLSGPGFFFMLDVGSGNDGNGTLLERSCPTQPTTASNATITAENFASVVEVLPPMHYKVTDPQPCLNDSPLAPTPTSNPGSGSVCSKEALRGHSGWAVLPYMVNQRHTVQS